MSGKCFVDTNVLVYLFDADAPAKRDAAARWLEEHADRVVLSTQVLQEFYVAVTRKLGRRLPEDEAEAAVRRLASFEVVPIDAEIVLAAIGRSRRHRLAFWDSLIVETALSRGCTVLVTEDFQNGRRFESLEVRRPF
jgi:predicted nucleic acid-binding protein